jgi:hypothetical protein
MFFYAPYDDPKGLGECRRYAPKPKIGTLEDARTYSPNWVQMLDDEWCGEFEYDGKKL